MKLKLSKVKVKIMLPVIIPSFSGDLSFRFGAWIARYISRVHKSKPHIKFHRAF